MSLLAASLAKKRHMKLPTYVQIEPVGQCNLRCQMCSIQFRKDGPPYGPPAFMKFETFTRIVDQFVGLQELHLQGLGEPMMHPGFFDMVEYAVKKGIRVTTNSNLTLLNDRRAERNLQTPMLNNNASAYVRILNAWWATWNGYWWPVNAREVNVHTCVWSWSLCDKTCMNFPTWCVSHIGGQWKASSCSTSVMISGSQACRHSTFPCDSLYKRRHCLKKTLNASNSTLARRETRQRS